MSGALKNTQNWLRSSMTVTFSQCMQHSEVTCIHGIHRPPLPKRVNHSVVDLLKADCFASALISPRV